MKRDYWEKMAGSYEEEIFDVRKNDRKKLITKAIWEHSSKKKTVIDIGCAIGKWLPVLSPVYKEVIALDISKKNLQIAQDTHPTLKNVKYVRVDMSGVKKLQRCDVGICINAILTPNLKDRDVFFHSLNTCLKKGGHIILTVPSLESWLLTSVVQNKWNIDPKLFMAEKNAREGSRKWNNIRQGNVDIDKVPHKHYLQEELDLLLSSEGFKDLRFEKIEYDWSTEFNKPPKWLKNPKPWDWMVVGTKK
jgi:2-polyprenyl-3-methyl-5-hydroxy-6-metoxy-1,4-benzoquinol methylase